MTFDSSTTRRGAMSSGAAAALGIAGAAVPATASSAPAPMGENDRRLCAIRDRMRALYREAYATPSDAPDPDALHEPLWQERDVLESEALATVPDDARGAAVRMRLTYAMFCDVRGNEMGYFGPDYDGGDGSRRLWHAAKALEEQARAIDPGFRVWPGGCH